MTITIHWYDPANGLWSDTQTANSVRVPDLDGHLCFDPLSRVAASTDWGQVIHGLPSAVLQPESIDDIVKMVGFCRSQGIKVGARGQAHSMYGQSQVTEGLVIAMSWLNKIHSIDSHSVSVDAGVTWRDLLIATVEKGLSPPILTDYLLLSVGGTLSVGGVNGASYKYGAQVDNVLELDVVTGKGELITCSPSQNQDLFEAVLGGLGQCAIIVSARIGLIAAPQRARVFDMAYVDLKSLLEDFRMLLADGRFSYLEGFVQPLPIKGFAYILEAVSFYDTQKPDDSTLLRDLHYLGEVNVSEHTYFDFCDRVTFVEAEKRAAHRWNLPHPSFDMFVPDQYAEDYIDDTLNKFPYDDIVDLSGFIYGFCKDTLTCPFPRTPDTGVFFLLDVLRTTDPERVSQAVHDNKQFYDSGCSIGGRLYPISAIPLSENDWQRHFEPYMQQLQKAKSCYDPDGILTPGPGIFGKDRKLAP